MVTGAMRSGTTFVGRVLAMGPRRAYVHEPFNPSCGLPSVPIRYLVDDSDLGRAYDLDNAIASIQGLRCRLGTGIHRQDTAWRRAAKRVVGGRGRLNLRMARLSPFLEAGIIKDPIGALVAPTLHHRHGVDVVVMVRHPVAWYASTQHHGFDLDLAVDSLLRQHESSPGLLEPDEVARAQSADRLERSSVVWNAVYRRLQRELAGRSGAVFVRHEDLARAPLVEFERIASEIDLPLTAWVRRRVARATRASNPVEARSGRPHRFHRDSRRLFEHRVSTVGPNERALLWDCCGAVAGAWYDEASFRGVEPGGRDVL